MAYKFNVGKATIDKVLEEIRKGGAEKDLSDALDNSNAGVSIDANGRLIRRSPDLQDLGTSDDVVVDSLNLDRIQEIIREKGLDRNNPFLARVAKARPPECDPPYDCGNTIMS